MQTGELLEGHNNCWCRSYEARLPGCEAFLVTGNYINKATAPSANGYEGSVFALLLTPGLDFRLFHFESARQLCGEHRDPGYQEFEVRI